MKPLKPHEQRAIDEKAELDKKTVSLWDFLHTERFRSLDDGTKQLLRHQFHVMLAYSEVLEARIARFT